MTATGAEADENLVPVGPARRTGDPADGEPILVPTAGDPDAPTDGEPAGEPTDGEVLRSDRPGPRRRLYRAVGAAALALLAGYGAWLLARQGIRTDAFPPFLAGAESTQITRYSGPWLTASAGAALLAALLLMSAVMDTVRWSRSDTERAE